MTNTEPVRFPAHLQICTTDICNVNPSCVMCSLKDRTNACHISDEYMEKCFSLIRQCDRIGLHGAGEPLIYPRLFEVISKTKENCYAFFNSNGRLLNDKNIEQIVNSNLKMIDFSLDAATNETYKKIRHGNLDAVVNNIKKLNQRKKDLNKIFPIVYINMVLMLENMSEISKFVELGKELEAQQVHIFHMNVGYSFQQDWFFYEEQHCNLQPKTHDYYVEEGFKRAEELGVYLVMSGTQNYTPRHTPLPILQPPPQPPGLISLSEVSIPKNAIPCRLPWNTMLVSTNGLVYNCCYQEGSPIGDLNKQSLEEIWNSSIINEIRASLDKGVFPSACLSNNKCSFRGRE